MYEVLIFFFPYFRVWLVEQGFTAVRFTRQCGKVASLWSETKKLVSSFKRGCNSLNSQFQFMTANQNERKYRNQPIRVKTCKLRKAREKASDQDAVGLKFECDWLRKWRESSGNRRKYRKTNQSRITLEMVFSPRKTEFTVLSARPRNSSPEKDWYP